MQWTGIGKAFDEQHLVQSDCRNGAHYEPPHVLFFEVLFIWVENIQCPKYHHTHAHTQNIESEGANDFSHREVFNSTVIQCKE